MHEKEWNGSEQFPWVSFDPFHATCLFIYPLKTSESQRFPDVFRGSRKRPVVWNGLILSIFETHFVECKEMKTIIFKKASPMWHFSDWLKESDNYTAV